MKANREDSISRSESGSVLMVTLVITVIVGVIAVSYLSMVSSSSLMTARSEAWEFALAVAEAGAEEGLAHLRENGIRKLWDPPVGTNLESQGWTFVDGKLHVRRALDDAYYEVDIELGIRPIITSAGFVPAPATVAAGSGPVWATVGNQPWDSGQPFISRRIRVQCRTTGRFSKAILGKDRVELNGKNVYVDSYDSYDTGVSTWDGTNSAGGLYDPAERRDRGDVAVIKGLKDVLKVSKATVLGRVSTGPQGNVKLDSKALVGSLSWVATHTSGIEPGWSADDANFDMPPVEVPFTSGTPPTGGTVGTNYYDYILGDGDYELAQFKGSVLVTGNARLLVTEKVEFSEVPSDNHGIEFDPGATLHLYVAKGDAKLVGKKDKKKGPSVKMYLNGEGNPTNFFYFGLDKHKKIEIKNMDDFSGIIYAPNADIHIKAGSLKYYHCIFHGAVMGKKISLEKNVDFHYDENIQRLSMDDFAVESWTEL